MCSAILGGVDVGKGRVSATHAWSARRDKKTIQARSSATGGEQAKAGGPITVGQCDAAQAEAIRNMISHPGYEAL
jgi:hypothetical protein